MPYCVQADLLLGEIPTPSYMDVLKYIDNASEEVDVALGQLYTTPIEVVEIAQNKPTTLFLKQVTAKLATGRIIMAAATGKQDIEVNAYGKYLIDEAWGAIANVLSGNYVLPGATQIDAPASDVGGVRLKNVDAISQVEGFYNQVQAQPVPYSTPGYPEGWLGGFPRGY